MPIISHGFRDYEIDPETEILIIGTFNPETAGNTADFFYGRTRNFLWRLLPVSFGENDLKGKSKMEKLRFMESRKIGFVDLISEVNVNAGDETNYKDDFIDDKITVWRDVIAEISRLKKLNKVCFSRKTLVGIPNIRARILEIEKHCKQMNIPVEFLQTPARIYSAEKQRIWTEYFSSAKKI